MLIYEYKLAANKAQYAAIDGAIRITQFIRNKCLSLWMSTRGVSKNDLQCYCAVLAQRFPFVSSLNSQARQAAADRAWSAISRFYDNCKNHKPGKKGYPRFQHDNRSVEYKQTGWKLEPDGRHISFTDGCEIGRLRLVGNKKQCIEAFPVKQIKRVRIIRRADGYYCQFAYEHLQIRNLVKNHKLSKSISDASWGRFLSWLTYYGHVYNIPVIAVEPAFTSQDCSVCGTRIKKALSVRTHICSCCGLVLDRDHNAALNILARARDRTAGHAETGTPQRVHNASGQTPATRSDRVRAGKVSE